MDALPATSTAGATLQTILLISQTILLLTFLASHHFQPQDQILQAIHDAVSTATAPRVPSTQALVEKAQHLVTELNGLLVSIDSHHEEILTLRRRIQRVDQRLSGHPAQNSSTPHGLRDPQSSVPSAERSGDAAKSSFREAGKRSSGKEVEDAGDEDGSQEPEERDPEPERRHERGPRAHKKGSRRGDRVTKGESNAFGHEP